MDKFILLTVVFISMILSACDTIEEDSPRKGVIHEVDEVPPEEQDPLRKESQEGTDEDLESPESAKEGENQESEEEPREITIDVVFEDKLVDQDTFVDDVKVGDEVLIRLENGVKTVPKFSEAYLQRVTSSWVKSECGLTHIDVSQKQGGKVYDCIKIKEYGDCNISRRNHVGEVDSPIVELARELDYFPIQFVLGGKPYRPDKINSHGGSSDTSSITASLKITEGMVQETNELYLQPISTTDGTVRVGFLDYSHCPNRKKEEFQISPPTALQFHEVPYEVKRRFQVDLSIIRDPSLRPSP